jgi:hypothetical protein
LLDQLASPKTFGLFLVQAGYAAIAIGQGDELIDTKVIRKYMTRKTQGKSQLTYKETKGKSRLGSRIRLQQAKIFFDELNEVIRGWEAEYQLEVVFLSCSPKLRGAWSQEGMPISKEDPRLRRVPIDVHRPNRGELDRVHKLLCRAEGLEAEPVPSLTSFQSWDDWRRWALSPHPRESLKTSMSEGGLHAYPELTNLREVPQDHVWHPEGDVWVHTLWVVAAAADIADREELDEGERIILLLSALCHDLGKPGTTEEKNGRVHAWGHCELGVQLSEILLKRMDCPSDTIELVKPLVNEHLVHVSIEEIPTPRMLQRLEKRLFPATMSQLRLLIEADISGRPPLEKGLPPKAVLIFEAWRDLDSERGIEEDSL